MAIFNLIHMSDLHLAAGGAEFGYSEAFNKLDPTTWGLFKAHDPNTITLLCGEIERHRRLLDTVGQDLDCIVLSGDIATTGHITDIGPAFTFVDQQLLALVPPNNRPHLFLTPGNHDRYGKYSLPGEMEFESLFAPKYWPPVTGKQISTFHEIVLPEKNGERLALVGCDFSLRQMTSWKDYPNVFGTGLVTKDQAAELADRTRSIIGKFTKRAAVIWVIHFPPSDGSTEIDKMARYTPPQYRITEQTILDGWQRVETVAAQLKVPILILSGHIHEPRLKFEIGKNKEVWCAGSAAQRDETTGHWYHTLVVRVQNGEIVEAQRTNFVRVGLDFKGGMVPECLGIRNTMSLRFGP